MAEPMVLTIFSRILFQGNPSLMEMIPAKAADNISAIWLAPANVSSNKKTLDVKRTMRIIMGNSAVIRLASRFM